MISPPCELAATSVGDVGCHLMLVTRLSNGLAVQYSLAVDNDLVYGFTKDFMTKKNEVVKPLLQIYKG